MEKIEYRGRLKTLEIHTELLLFVQNKMFKCITRTHFPSEIFALSEEVKC